LAISKVWINHQTDTVRAQDLTKMPLELLSQLPDFVGKDQFGKKLVLSEFSKGRWTVVFSYPQDFTPICSTEMATFARMQQDFAKRNCSLIGISADSSESHATWVKDIETLSKVKVDFPMIADESGEIIQSLGLALRSLNKDGEKRTKTKVTPSRTLYIVDPEQIVQFVQVMPQNTGRNVTEILRVLDSLQLSVLQSSIGTPAGWTVGSDVVILPDASTEEVSRIRKIAGKLNSPFPYLRFAPLNPLRKEGEVA
jgi:alkyl hydroperoxide reductase subunit AhpC